MRRSLVLLSALIVLVAACSTTTPSPSPSFGQPDPSAPAIGSPLPSVEPPTSAPPSEPAPAGTPTPSMTPEEEALIGALRLDAAVNCEPRRTDLPEGALHAIECRPDDPLVARVGIYRFASENEAAFAYMTRMASYGVDVNAGSCARDVPGDSAWTPGDDEGSIEDPGVFNWENSVLSPNRIGCFRDENGNANVRSTCGDTYVGVLGTGADLSDLHDWTWTYPVGYDVATPDMPGLCIGDALFDPDV